mgnify:CR=1 FL=1
MIEEEKKIENIPEIMPIIGVEGFVVFPYLLLPVSVTEARDIEAVNIALKEEKVIGLFPIKREGKREISIPEDIYDIGTAASIARMIRMPDDSIKVLLQGMKRIKIKRIINTEGNRAEIKILDSTTKTSEELEALKRTVTTIFIQIVRIANYLPDDMALIIESIADPSRLCDFIAANVNLNIKDKIEILCTINIKDRLKKLTGYLQNEMNILQLGEKLRSEVSTELNKEQKEYYLREQLKAIQKELGEKDEKTIEIEELSKKIEEKVMSEEAKEIARKEVRKLEKIPTQAADFYVTVNYINWLLELPWGDETEDNIDIKKAAEILDEDHYDLKSIKERILEFLAVRKLKKNTMGTILCFVGPPGVGKTSLGKSIAKALNRKFVRLALGGVRDEAEIRGHRRTYVGALPGRILQEIKRVKTRNPVFMIDEIDKIGMDFRGDPTSALLEVLDPEQNDTFVDHYIEIPFDLSHVFFITTANVLETIPPPLRDRMEIIRIAGYTVDEKAHIAEKYLVPRQIDMNGLKNRKITFDYNTIKLIIESYTMEAGVRNLERTVGSIMRKIAKDIVFGKRATRRITKNIVNKYLGKPIYIPVLAKKKPVPGVTTGMAWTPVGGVILFIEVAFMPGNGKYILTGQLGNVMKESCEIALSYVRSNVKRYNIDEEFHMNKDIHIHVPEGAVSKDGPSAGIAIITSIISLLSNTPAKPNIAMTGEITLKGDVLPIGGVKEKVLGANRAGIKEIILPKDNEKDIDDIPETVRNMTTFYFVRSIDEVIDKVLIKKNIKRRSNR